MMLSGHHKGVEPDPLPCPVRSIHMRQICSDPWDADWIDPFDKKTIFELITASNDLQIKCLCMYCILILCVMFFKIRSKNLLQITNHIYCYAVHLGMLVFSIYLLKDLTLKEI